MYVTLHNATSPRKYIEDFRPQRSVEPGAYRGDMTYVIGTACVDVVDKSCIEDCPVDCMYEGDRKLYINPDECVDCGACKLLCKVDAIYWEDDLPADQRQHLADDAAFFAEVLPGRTTPLGNPGGAAGVGRIGVDTPLVAGLAPRAGYSADQSAFGA